VKRRLFEDWNAYLETVASNDPCDDILSFQSRVSGREIRVQPSLEHQPEGISCVAVPAGVKSEGVLDFTVVKLRAPGSAAAVFTKSLCPSHAVTYDKERLANGRAQLLAVVSKNANVYTPTGDQDTRTLARWLASEFDVEEDDVVISCTGVIGVPLPMSRLEQAITGLSSQLAAHRLDDTAQAILTTDRAPKVCSVRVAASERRRNEIAASERRRNGEADDLVVCAMAKGAGMIEPNMATMLVYFFTNAAIDPLALKAILVEASERTFNSITVDSDTSTSDTVAMFATASANLDEDTRADLIDAVRCMSIKLARDIVAQSEGATKLIECTVSLDTSPSDARIMAKKIVNSPLVKTAVHGGDPNWGRLVMAIGKPDERLQIRSIAPEDVVIELMGQVVFPRGAAGQADLQGLAQRLKGEARVSIDLRIGEGLHRAKVWGCDLSAQYVEINSDYTT
jgi:glutamate N-acetyltransferase/amino-acid N-acetyltransferase